MHEEVERFRTQVKAFYRRMRREQLTVDGLSTAALQVLTAAELSPTPMRPGELATALMMRSPNVAVALRTLESLGLVERRQHPTDGRKAFVDVTDKGREVVAESRQSRRAWLYEAADRLLSDDEQRQLFAAGDLLERLSLYEPAAEYEPSRARAG